MKNKTILTLSLLITFFSVFSQQKNSTIIIKGKVLDSKSGAIIKYCNITDGETSSLSNEDGEFIFKINSLPSRLVFSNINYELKNTSVTSTQNLVIKLDQKDQSLAIENEAVALTKKAYSKINNKRSEKKYGKAIYRQKTKNEAGLYEFSEIFFDATFNRNGIIDWDLHKGRYALKDGFINNKNFSYFSKIIKTIQPKTNDVIFPLRPNPEEYYTISIDQIKKSKHQEIAILKFQSKKEISTPIFEGYLYVDLKSFDVYKVKGSINNDNFEVIKFSKKKASYKNYSLSYDLNFVNNGKEEIVLDYLKVDQSFTYLKENKSNQKVSTSSLIKFFTYEDKVNNEKNNSKGNWKKLNDFKYNVNFWRNNPIVKRTTTERNLSDDFEKKYAFDALFINNRKQITSQQKLIGNTTYINELDSLMKSYNKRNQIEKIYIQTNKDIYAPGEVISYFGYHLDGSSHQPIFNQNVVYVDLISLNDKKVVAKKIKQTINGTIKGGITFDHDLKKGSYKLIAYTNWMRNFDSNFFFSKTIEIQDDNNHSKEEKDTGTHLVFFPEGGNLINDKVNRIAFKATNLFGDYKDIKGKIIDSKNNLIHSFESKFQGCGSFNLKPKLNETYFAILEDGKKYVLPKSKKDGYLFTVNNINENTINIRIETTKKFKNNEFYLLGHMYRDRFYQGKFKFSKTPYIHVEIPKTKLPTGVLVFSILNSKKELMAERAIFINNLEHLNIDSKITFQKTDTDSTKVNFNTRTSDTNAKNVASNIFITVLSETNKLKKDLSKNITTYLNLESEIKGNIELPNILLMDNKRITKSKLDLLMLSHDFRKYDWDKLNSVTTELKKYKKEQNLVIKGKAKNKLNQLLKNTSIRAIAKSIGKINIYKCVTNVKGQFVISDFNHEGETELVFEAISNNVKTNQIRVELISENEKNSVYNILNNDNSINEPKFEDKIAIIKNTGLITLNKDNIKLDEVIINGKRRKKKRRKSLYNISVSESHTLDEKELRSAGSIMDVIDRVPGVRIRGDALKPRILLNNSKVPPLIILDGVQLNGGETITSNIFASQIATMDLSAIERIEVLQGNETSLFGTRGVGGVIIMYSKRGKNAKLRLPKPLSNFIVKGFDSTNQPTNLLSSNLFTNNDSKIIMLDHSEPIDNILIQIESLSSKGQNGYQIKRNIKN